MILLAIREQQKLWWWTRLEDWFKRYGMSWLEIILQRTQLSPEVVRQSDLRSILVIRQHDQLGDFLLSVPVLYALRDHSPHANISLLVREYFADVARCIPCVDEVIVFHEDGRRWTFGSAVAFLRRLRSPRDLTIVLATVSHSLTSDLLAHWSRARFVLGSAERVFPGCRRNFLYNLIAPARPLPRHQTERNLDIIRYLGVSVERIVGTITVPDAAIQHAREFLKSHGRGPSSRTIGIHLGAGKPANRWPVESFADLAHQVWQKYNATIILFWGPEEEDLCESFIRQSACEPVKVGHPPLLALAGFFRLCTVLVCNDTGMMHLGASVGIPVVALFGPTDPDEWKPLTPACTAIRAPEGLIENIKVVAVLTELERIIASEAGRQTPSP